MRITDTHIYFWGSYLSNWEPCTIFYDNIEFYSSEHLFMYFKAKAFNDLISANKIIRTKSPSVAKAIGREVENFDELVWSSLREDYMFKACFEKFIQNESFKQQLLDTNDKTLVEASPTDKIWGIGLKWDNDKVLYENNWKGLNLLGKSLMKVREHLKKLK